MRIAMCDDGGHATVMWSGATTESTLSNAVLRAREGRCQ